MLTIFKKSESVEKKPETEDKNKQMGRPVLAYTSYNSETKKDEINNVLKEIKIVPVDPTPVIRPRTK